MPIGDPDQFVVQGEISEAREQLNISSSPNSCSSSSGSKAGEFEAFKKKEVNLQGAYLTTKI